MRIKGLLITTIVVAIAWAVSTTPSWAGAVASEALHKAFVIAAPVAVLSGLLTAALWLTGRWVVIENDLHNAGRFFVEWRDPLTYLGIGVWLVFGFVLAASVGYWATWHTTVETATREQYQYVYQTVMEGHETLDAAVIRAAYDRNAATVHPRLREQAVETVWRAQTYAGVEGIQRVGGQITAIVDGTQFVKGTRGVIAFGEDGEATLCNVTTSIGSLHGILTTSMASAARRRVGRPVQIDTADAYGTCENGTPVVYLPFTEYKGWWWPVEVPTGVVAVRGNGVVEIVDYNNPEQSKHLASKAWKDGPWFPTDLLAAVPPEAEGILHVTFSELSQTGFAQQVDTLKRTWTGETDAVSDNVIVDS